MDVGGVAARGDPHHDVLGAQAARRQVLAARLAVVLGPLDGVAQGVIAARDDPLDQLGIGREGGRALRGIEHPEAPAGARAHVEEAAA
ncbi:hypothetical protein D3C86_1838230 [compost metagenome]